MIKKNLIKLVSLVSLFSLTFNVPATNIFASTNSTSKNKNKNFTEVSRIYSSQSSLAEKIAFINSRNKSDSANDSNYTVNEFDLCKSIDKKSGLSPNQKGSKVAEYIQKLKVLAKEDNSTLAKMGISQNRMQSMQTAARELSNTDVISTSDLTQNQMSALSLSSATCNLYKHLDGYFYNESYMGRTFKTLIYVTSGWKWNTTPILNDYDGFANAWSSATNLQLYKTFDASEYYDTDTNQYLSATDYSSTAFNNRAGQLNGESFNFIMNTMYNSNGKRLFYEYPKTGYSMNVLVSTDFQVGSLTYNSEYTHSFTPLAPSISIGVGGGISLSFAYGKTCTPIQQTYFMQKSDYNPNY